MIQPDRLKELIKRKETIWLTTFNNVHSYELKENINNGFYYDIDDECLLLMKEMNNEEDYPQFAWKLEDLFETEADAKWYLEFGKITREEKLSLPSWEDLEDFGCIRINSNTYLNWNKVINWISICAGGTECYFETATKENYIDACRLCKKLFLGSDK